MITVKNEATIDVEVSINHWGDTGDTSYNTLNTNETTTWDRSDYRGFVLAVIIGSIRVSFLVNFNSNVVVKNKSVTIDGTVHTITDN